MIYNYLTTISTPSHYIYIYSKSTKFRVSPPHNQIFFSQQTKIVCVNFSNWNVHPPCTAFSIDLSQRIINNESGDNKFFWAGTKNVTLKLMTKDIFVSDCTLLHKLTVREINCELSLFVYHTTHIAIMTHYDIYNHSCLLLYIYKYWYTMLGC